MKKILSLLAFTAIFFSVMAPLAYAESFDLEQYNFRWRYDDGSETEANWFSGEGVNAPFESVDRNYRLRLGVQGERHFVYEDNFRQVFDGTKFIDDALVSTDGSMIYAALPGDLATDILKFEAGDFDIEDLAELDKEKGHSVRDMFLSPNNDYLYAILDDNDNEVSVYVFTTSDMEEFDSCALGSSIEINNSAVSSGTDRAIINYNNGTYVLDGLDEGQLLNVENDCDFQYVNDGSYEFIDISAVSEDGGYSYTLADDGIVRVVDLSTPVDLNAVVATQDSGFSDTFFLGFLDGSSLFFQSGTAIDKIFGADIDDPGSGIDIDQIYTLGDEIEIAQQFLYDDTYLYILIPSSVVDPDHFEIARIKKSNGKIDIARVDTDHGDPQKLLLDPNGDGFYAFLGHEKNEKESIRIAKYSFIEDIVLEYGEKETTCSEIEEWEEISEDSEIKLMNSEFVDHGDDTTRQLQTQNGEYKKGKIIEDDNKLSKIHLGEEDYTEIEYVLKANSLIDRSKAYCFRLASSDDWTYIRYPEFGFRVEPEVDPNEDDEEDFVCEINEVFADIENDDEDCAAITYVNEQGIFTGTEEGNLEADRSVNRAEAMKIMVEMLSVSLEEDDSTEGLPYSDISDGAWYNRYLKYGTPDIIQGYDDGTYRPNVTVNRAEFAKIFLEALEVDLSEYPEKYFEDIAIPPADFIVDDSNKWWARYMSYLLDFSLIDEEQVSDSDARLVNANDGMNRRDIIKMIYRFYLLNNQE